MNRKAIRGNDGEFPVLPAGFFMLLDRIKKHITESAPMNDD